MERCINIILYLTSFAVTEQHAAIAAFTHAWFYGEAGFLLRTIRDIIPLMQPLEETIRLEFMPSLT